MTLEEMKLAVCEKLPELAGIFGNEAHWIHNGKREPFPINWPTEGLQVCHEAEKLITKQLEWNKYHFQLRYIMGAGANINRQLAAYDDRDVTTATYEQRLEALCRMWFPERFLG